MKNDLTTIFAENIESLLGKVVDKTIAVAVSGGVDSVALLILAHQFAKPRKIELIAMNVNHNLRYQAKFEAQYVAELTKDLGIGCVLVELHDLPVSSNIQQKAREMRYNSLTLMCKKMGIATLLTAHHLDDIIENFYLRNERKSGIFGLATPRVNIFNDTRILRPLFNLEKKHLISFLQEKKIKWLEDPSNQLPYCRRNIVRKQLTKLSQEKKISLIEDIKSNDQLFDIKKQELTRALAETMQIFDCGAVTISIDKIIQYEQGIILQILSYVLTVIGAKKQIPRADSVLLILSQILANNNFTSSLHGCIITKNINQLLIHKEFGRIAPVDIALKNGAIWDDRFLFKVKNNKILQDACITCLTLKDYQILEHELKVTQNTLLLPNLTQRQHKLILFTLPVVKIFEKLVALPHISYYDKALDKVELSVSFHTNFTSRFVHVV